MIVRNPWQFSVVLTVAFVFAGHSIVPAEEVRKNKSIGLTDVYSQNRGEARLSISATAKRKLNKNLKKKLKKNSNKLKKLKLKKLPKDVKKSIIRFRKRPHDGKINSYLKSTNAMSKPKSKPKSAAAGK